MDRQHAAIGTVACAALVTLTACSGDTTGTAEQFPSERLRIVVPYPPGGALDVAARGVAPCLEEHFGQTVIVENKPGGSGAVGTQAVLNAPADGHTMEMVLTSSAVVAPLAEDVGYGLEDFSGVGEVARYPYLLLVNPDSPFSSAEELLTAAEEEPGSIKAAAPGANSQGTIELERIRATGAELTIVPFEGTAGVKTALAGNTVDVGTAIIDEAILEQVKQGSLRVLATLGEDRVPYLPDVPALNEIAGYEDFREGTSFVGLVTRAGTPDATRSALEAAVGECLDDEATVERIGDNFVSDDFVEGAELMDSFQQQSEVYAEILQE